MLRDEHPANPHPHPHPHPRSFSLLLAKNARSRWGEDALVSKLLIKAIAESMGISAQSLQIDFIESGAATDRFEARV
jgi:hypothetical protein